MNRYNCFHLIHKSLRGMMYDTALTLQQTYFADSAEAEEAIAKVEEVIYHFEQHAHHEDSHVLPAIEAYAPQLVASFEAEHEADHELGNKLTCLLNMFKSLDLPTERLNFGSALNRAFREFMVFNLEHMAKEECEINKVLWENFTDQQLMELNGKIVASISPADMAVNAKWFMRSINKEEATGWLKAVKAAVPPFVFDKLFAMTETELPERFRAEVQDAVMANEMVYLPN